jgi:hypothetical protein
MTNTKMTTILIIIFLILEVALWQYALMGMNPFITNILIAFLVIYFLVIAYRIYKTPTKKERWFLIRIFVAASLIANLISYFLMS